MTNKPTPPKNPWAKTATTSGWRKELEFAHSNHPAWPDKMRQLHKQSGNGTTG